MELTFVIKLNAISANISSMVATSKGKKKKQLGIGSLGSNSTEAQKVASNVQKRAKEYVSK
jgi:hypothetical protein